MASLPPPAPSAPLTPLALPGLKLTTIDLVGGIFCQICNLVFGNKKEFDAHYLAHSTGTEVITYTCVVCHLSSDSYPSFRGHCYTRHVIKDKFRCDSCNKSFSKLSALKEHIASIHSFKCNKKGCDKRFPTKKELHLHQIIHKDDNKPPYQCQTCFNEIDNIETCEDHIDKHCIFTYPCPLCNEHVTKDNATQHLTKHFGDVLNEFNELDVEETPEDSSINIVGGILCCHCQNLFKNRIEIDTHFAEEHTDQDVKYTCVICHKQHDKYSLYGDHCYYHYSKNRYVCDVCERTFARLSLLVAHAEVHKQDGNIDAEISASERDTEPRCRLCNLRLADAAAAVRHLAVHRRTQFSCPVCAKTYAEKYLLMKHTPQHFEAVFHMCKVCSKVFPAKNRLIQHVKIHSTVKNYECQYCSKCFLKPYQLSQHVNVHTGARPYACVACPKTFASMPNWSKHVLRMHNIDPKTISKSMQNNIDSDTDSFKQDSPQKRMEHDFIENMTAEETKKLFDFCDEIMAPESIDSSVVEREAERYEFELKSLDANVDMVELTPILSEDIDKFVSEMLSDAPANIPREYGPDFLAEDLPLAHVAPQLAAPPAPPAPLAPLAPPPAWEPPVFTKVCSYYGDLEEATLSFIDTDLF